MFNFMKYKIEFNNKLLSQMQIFIYKKKYILMFYEFFYINYKHFKNIYRL